MTSIEEHFGELTDPRVEGRTAHKLLDIITIALCSMVCGVEHFTEMEEFGAAKEAWFRTFLELPGGIPSHHTFGRVFAALNPDEFRGCFIEWTQAISERTGGDIIAIDGKAMRGARRSKFSRMAVHMVSAWSSRNSLVLGQLKVHEKSNEITAVPQLLALLDIEGCTVTVDALNTQKAIAAQIVEQKGDYVMALKGNHGTLHKEVTELFEEGFLDDFEELDVDEFSSEESGHGRIETRRVWVCNDIDRLPAANDWPHIASVALVQSERTVHGQFSYHHRYYISSHTAPSAQFIAQAVRQHWSIENQLHWSLDVQFREDECRVRKDNAPENLAISRHIITNVLKRDTRCKRGLKTKRKLAGWDHDYLLHILALLHPQDIPALKS